MRSPALPRILEFGSIGTADLAALCGTALTLMGERPATAPLEAMAPWSKESALPFVSSNALTIGRAILAAHDLRELVDAGLVVYALTAAGLECNPSPFHPAAARGVGLAGSERLAERVRALLHDGAPRRIQDPYGLRAFLPSTIGLVEALDRLDHLLDAISHAAQENPLFVFDEEGKGLTVAHNSNFLQAPLSLTVDAVKVALAQTVPLNVSRIRMMTEPEHTGLAPFLATGAASASGVMMIEYVVAGAYGSLHSAAQPNSLTTVVLSRGAEEDASFANESVVQLERAVHAYRAVIAGELVIAARLLRQRGIAPEALTSPSLAAAYRATAQLDPDDSDRDQRPDLQEAERLIPVLAALARD
ncbi:aromatic amino acid lyase [Microbacterium sp. cx-59]|uniref:aromatic amino acid lyase n=1 Tax=Microbacterium sp. cx-59 TaxID=2891207 RepID=UPI002256A6F5|nr:aromatic amino acid lyase [Microbacterium sp. cx-59]